MLEWQNEVVYESLAGLRPVNVFPYTSIIAFK